MTSPFNPRDVELLAAALPTEGDNPIGRAARSVLARHAKRLTPGNYSQMFGTGPAFRDIFFPGIQYDPNEAFITPLTGADDAFFRAVAIALLCQQMGRSTSRIRPQILLDKTVADLGGWSGQLIRSSYRFYAHMAGVTDGPIRAALGAFPTPAARDTAKAHYIGGLTSAAWINAKKVQDSSGQWFDRDWELYHHWIKLTALGAQPGEIDQAIISIVAQGLPIPAAYGAGAWQQRAPWFGGDLGSGDVAEAVGPILATKCHVYPGAMFPSCMAEDNSYEFTANSQPGTNYRQLPKSSCFAPGTLVVLADGSLRPIEQVNPGDEAATAHGPRRVLLRMETDRAGRVLNRFAGSRFAFASTHPFVQATGEPGRACYAALDPAGLARSVPMLSAFGISPLTPQDAVLVRHTPGGGEPMAAPAVEAVEGPGPDTLHDLYLEVGEDGRSEYYAGDEDLQVLVSSEAPRFEAAPDTARVLLKVLERVTGPILEDLAPVSPRSFADVLDIGLTSLSRTLMAKVGPHLAGPAPAADATHASHAGADGLAAAARAFARGLDGADADSRWRRTIVFEQFVAAFAGQFQAAIEMGWRSFALADGDVADLLVADLYDVELYRPLAGPLDAVDLTLVRGTARSTRRLKPIDRDNRWYLTVDGPGYFPEWSPPGQAAVVSHAASGRRAGPGGDTPPAQVDPDQPDRRLWDLEVALNPETGIGALLPLAGVLSHGYDTFDAPLFDAAGARVGRIRGDVRLLTSEGFAAEWEAREAWQPSQQPRIGDRLADLAAEYITENFLLSVEEFRFCAATTSTPFGPTAV